MADKKSNGEELKQGADSNPGNSESSDNNNYTNITLRPSKSQTFASWVSVFATLGLVYFAMKAGIAAIEYNELQKKANKLQEQAISLQEEQTTLQDKIINLQEKQFVAENIPLLSVYNPTQTVNTEDNEMSLSLIVKNHGSGSAKEVTISIILAGVEQNGQERKIKDVGYKIEKYFDVVAKGLNFSVKPTIDLEKFSWLKKLLEEENHLFMAVFIEYNIPKEFTLSGKVEPKTVNETYIWSARNKRFDFLNFKAHTAFLSIIPTLNLVREELQLIQGQSQ